MKIHESLPLIKEFRYLTGINLWNFKEPIIMAITGEFSLNIVAFDDELGKRDSEYSGEETMYKGKEGVSTSDYLILKYGERANEIIDLLINSKKENKNDNRN